MVFSGSAHGANGDIAKYRGPYMSAHVFLNLLKYLGKRDKMRGLPFSQRVYM